MPTRVPGPRDRGDPTDSPERSRSSPVLRTRISRSAAAIARHLGISLGDVALGRFPDGEVRFQIKDNVRGRRCLRDPVHLAAVNENLMELLLMVDALKRASAARINAVIPYYGYARQDRKDRPRVPVSAKLVADLLTVRRSAPGDRHGPPCGPNPGLLQHPGGPPLRHPGDAGDVPEPRTGSDRSSCLRTQGGVERARAYGKNLGVGIAVMDKRRGSDNQVETIHVVGDVRGRSAVLVDDIVDSAGTLVRAAEASSERRRHPGPGRCAPMRSFPAAPWNESKAVGWSGSSSETPSRCPPRFATRCTKIQVLSVASLFAAPSRASMEKRP